jgi:hypothetical protein
MIQGGPARDLIVVQLTPDAAPDVRRTPPRSSAASADRVPFELGRRNAGDYGHAHRRRAGRGRGERAQPAHAPNRRPRGELFEEGSALERSRAWIDRLYDEGRQGARRFLARHGRDIGVRETLNIAKVFSDERKPAAFARQRGGVRSTARTGSEVRLRGLSAEAVPEMTGATKRTQINSSVGSWRTSDQTHQRAWGDVWVDGPVNWIHLTGQPLQLKLAKVSANSKTPVVAHAHPAFIAPRSVDDPVAAIAQVAQSTTTPLPTCALPSSALLQATTCCSASALTTPTFASASTPWRVPTRA